MSSLVFDTHKAIKSLTEAGANEVLAEAVVATIGAAMAGNLTTKVDTAELKTELKGDIAELKTELKSDIAELKTELKSDIAELKHEMVVLEQKLTTLMYKLILGTAFGIVGLTVTLMKLL